MEGIQLETNGVCQAPDPEVISGTTNGVKRESVEGKTNPITTPILGIFITKVGPRCQGEVVVRVDLIL